MLVTFIDESIPYDGYTPTSQPLGGAEKSVVGLATALAAREHTVRVFNGCTVPVVAHGVSWQPLAECRASRTDWLIVHRKPALLERIADADRRALLLSTPAGYLLNRDELGAVNRASPVLLVQGIAHAFTIPVPLQSHDSASLHLGVGDSYLTSEPMAPDDPPHAIVTTHPARDLDWLLGLWCENVHPRVASAELHVYSAVLDKGALGAEVPESLAPVFKQAQDAAEHGVRIRRPLADPEMAAAYRKARVHLYPGSRRDVLCSTLAESQAVGLPAVARPLGASDERIRNGATGYLAPDDEAFANLAVRLLEDRETFDRLSGQARTGTRGPTWERAAIDLEKALGG
jgi:hypothetical protein